MSYHTAAAVTDSLHRFDNLARRAIEADTVHDFMQEHGEDIVSVFPFFVGTEFMIKQKELYQLTRSGPDEFATALAERAFLHTFLQEYRLHSGEADFLRRLQKKVRKFDSKTRDPVVEKPVPESQAPTGAVTERPQVSFLFIGHFNTKGYLRSIYLLNNRAVGHPYHGSRGHRVTPEPQEDPARGP